MKTWLTLIAALASAAALGQPAPSPASHGLTDAQVVHIVLAASRVDVDAAKLARTKASAPAVKAFAERMIRDNDALNGQATSLARRLRLHAEDNSVSRSLHQGARENLGNLRGFTKGRAFDRAYIAHEMAYHAAVLEVIDQSLLPAVEADLKALLVAARPTVAAHLADAREVDAGLPR